MDYFSGLSDGIIFTVFAVVFIIGNILIFFIINLLSRFNRLVLALPSCLFWSASVAAWGLYIYFFKHGIPDSARITHICGYIGIGIFMLAIIITYLIIIKYNYTKSNISSTYKTPQEIINPTCYLSSRYAVKNPNPSGSIWLRTRAELNYYSVNPIASSEREALKVMLKDSQDARKYVDSHF